LNVFKLSNLIKKSPRKAFVIWRYYKEDAKILNIGCGNLKISSNDSYVINVDIDPSVRPDIICDALRLPFKDDVFDIIFAFDILEHVTNPAALISEMERVCKSNGNIVIWCLDFDVCPYNWYADKDHKYYINELTFKILLPQYSLYRFGKDVLIAVRRPNSVDKLIFKFLEKVVNLYRIITRCPDNRATR